MCSSDLNGGAGITCTVTAAGGTGSIALSYVECDVFRLGGAHTSPALDLHAVTTVSTIHTTLSVSPAAGSGKPSFTDALALTFIFTGTLTGALTTNTFTGTSPTANLNLCVLVTGRQAVSQYVSGVQGSATAATNVFTNGWAIQSNQAILIGATFTYT